MDHEVSIIPRILDILEIEVSIIPRILEILGIGFFQFSHILEILEIGFFYFLISWKYGRRAGGGRAAPGVVLCCLGLFLEHVPGKMNMVTLELRSKQALF